MVLWTALVLWGFALLAFVFVLYVGAWARAGPVRGSRRLEYISDYKLVKASKWDSKSPAVVNVSPNMQHLTAWAPTRTTLHRPAGEVPA
jgi:hypothetical protein